MSKQTAQKTKLGSTQKFTEIEDIKEDIVLLTGGTACIIMEVQATNFELLSQEEQYAKIAAYGSLLNSLSFPVEIVIRNKRVDISSYLKLVDSQLQKAQPEGSQKRTDYIKQYRNFVEELIKINTVLNKEFYAVISYSSLERGISGVAIKKEDFFTQAKTALHTKAESLLAQLGRVGLKTKILDEDGLIRLFYDIYNQEGISGNGIKNTFVTPIVQGDKA